MEKSFIKGANRVFCDKFICGKKFDMTKINEDSSDQLQPEVQDSKELSFESGQTSEQSDIEFLDSDEESDYSFDSKENSDDPDRDIDDDSALSYVDESTSSPETGLSKKNEVFNTIKLRNQVFDLCFHPSRPLILSGLINGDVYCYSYSSETADQVTNQRKFELKKHHSQSCRGTKFSSDGNNFYTISKDRSFTICDTETGKEIYRSVDAHEMGLCSLLPLTENLLATGDDDGIVKIWDSRTYKSSIKYCKHEDFVSSMAFRPEENSLLSVGGDGFLSIMDIRKEKVIDLSDNLGEELLSVSIIKNGRKVVVGTQSGVLNLFTWGEWEGYSDRFPGHPDSVDCMVKLNEDTIVTGSADGVLRVIGILPNSLHGVLGHHDSFPVERLSISHDLNFLASCSHDRTIKFWPIIDLNEEASDEDSEDDDCSKRSFPDSSSDESGDEKGQKAAQSKVKEMHAKKVKKAAARGCADSKATFFDDL